MAARAGKSTSEQKIARNDGSSEEEDLKSKDPQSPSIQLAVEARGAQRLPTLQRHQGTACRMQ